MEQPNQLEAERSKKSILENIRAIPKELKLFLAGLSFILQNGKVFSQNPTDSTKKQNIT